MLPSSDTELINKCQQAHAIFTSTANLPSNLKDVLSNPAIRYWQLTGGGYIQDKECQKIRAGASKKLMFGSNSRYEVKCTLRTDSTSIRTTEIGQYIVNIKLKQITFHSTCGVVSNSILVALCENSLVLEDGDKFRYYYQAVQLGQASNVQG